MQILIFNEPEGKLMTILQTSWDPREALGWGEEAGRSDKREERGGRRMKMERNTVGAAEGGRDGVPCLPHFTDREMGLERGGNLPVTLEGGRREIERQRRGGR